MVMYLGALADAVDIASMTTAHHVGALRCRKPVVLSLLGDVLWWLRSANATGWRSWPYRVSMYAPEQGRERVEDIETLAVDSLQVRLKAWEKRVCGHASAEYPDPND